MVVQYMIASAPWGPTIDLLIEISPNASQPRVGTRNESGTPPTVSSRLHLFPQEFQLGTGSIGPTPAGGAGRSNREMGGTNQSSKLASGGSDIVGAAPFDPSHASKATISTKAAMTNTAAEPVDARDIASLRGDTGGSSREVSDSASWFSAPRSSRAWGPASFGCVAPGTYSSTPQFGQVDSLVSPCQSQRRQTFAVIRADRIGSVAFDTSRWFSSIGRNEP